MSKINQTNQKSIELQIAEAEATAAEAEATAAAARFRLLQLQASNTEQARREPAAAAARTERRQERGVPTNQASRKESTGERKAPKTVELSEVFEGTEEEAATIRDEIVEYLRENKHTHKRAQVSVGKIHYDLKFRTEEKYQGVNTLAGFMRVFRKIFYVHVIPDRDDPRKIFDTRVNLIVSSEGASEEKSD
jgi:hypothetical protein